MVYPRILLVCGWEGRVSSVWVGWTELGGVHVDKDWVGGVEYLDGMGSWGRQYLGNWDK